MRGTLRHSLLVLSLLSLPAITAYISSTNEAQASLPNSLSSAPLTESSSLDSLREIALSLDNRMESLVAVDSSMFDPLLLPYISTELRAVLGTFETALPSLSIPVANRTIGIIRRIDQQHRYIGLIVQTIDTRRRMMDALPLLTPIEGRLSSGFGLRVHPISGREKRHEGVDIAAPSGTPIHASGNGVVTFAGRRNGYGNTVQLAHSYGYATLYAHCSRLLVAEGDTVHRGEVIALVGSTGASTGPHLHYEVEVDGTKVDPHGFLVELPPSDS